jgi:hypothetical protein
VSETDTKSGLHFLALCLDNASSCDVLARTAGLLLLQKYDIEFHSENGRIRCMAHVVNLIVQAILAELDEGDNPDIFDWFLPNKHLPVHDDPDDDEEVQAFEREAYEGLDDDDEEELREFDKSAALGDEDEDELDKLDDDLSADQLSPIKKVCSLYCNFISTAA